jgi:hypothetical protein
MPVPVHDAPWWGSLAWLITVVVVAFAVAWMTGTRLNIRRGLYVPILFAVTSALAVGYVGWLGVGLGDVATTRWSWGLLAAALAPVVLWKPLSRQPVDRRVTGRRLRRELFWEGAVYGTAEGVLLSALPAFITWQMVHSLGWSGVGGGLARWTMPLIAADVVVVVHHLGYWNCRGAILIPITLALTVLSAGFLLTASWIAAALGHVFMHVEATVHGIEMPPVERPRRHRAPLPHRDLAGVR